MTAQTFASPASPSRITTKDRYYTWLDAVNRIIASTCWGLTLDDLPDCPTADWFDEGVSTRSAARRAIRRIDGKE